MTVVAQAIRLTKRYVSGAQSVVALDCVSLAAARGEFIGITGPSGSGKSTLLNILGLADAPSEGELFLGGTRVPFEAGDRKLAMLRRCSIGYVFQHFSLLRSLTAEENVTLPLILNGVEGREARRRAKELLASVGLSSRENNYPAQLSGGEMQRVAVCRAVIHKPTLILADEPTGNLDPASGETVLEMLKRLARDGNTIVMATHSERAMEFCSRLVRLRGGAAEAEVTHA